MPHTADKISDTVTTVDSKVPYFQTKTYTLHCTDLQRTATLLPQKCYHMDFTTTDRNILPIVVLLSRKL